ncbi:MAG: hypothetical protein DME60_09905 [Verrucomicrobia bacterium]|nr:MAG: hypothetical protein DME60_09905 [Verrucomicrobiota bacterium]
MKSDGRRVVKLRLCGFIGQLDFCAKEYWECGIRWLVMNIAAAANGVALEPQTSFRSVLNDIAILAEANPSWLDISAAL